MQALLNFVCHSLHSQFITMFFPTVCLLMMTLVGCSMGCTPGSPGRDGQDGTNGRDGVATAIQKSAFTAVKTSVQSGNSGDVLTFDETPTNQNGHFSLTTGKFTCVFPGTYFFTFTFGVWIRNPGSRVYISIVKNGNRIVTAHARLVGTEAENDFDTATASVVLELEAGAQVWLQFLDDNESVHSTASGYTSFSGYLIY